MITDRIKEEVEARVRVRFIAELFPALEQQHMRKGFHTCDCDYCQTKRWVSHLPGYSLYRRMESDVMRDAIRNRLARMKAEGDRTWV